MGFNYCFTGSDCFWTEFTLSGGGDGKFGLFNEVGFGRLLMLGGGGNLPKIGGGGKFPKIGGGGRFNGGGGIGKFKGSEGGGGGGGGKLPIGKEGAVIGLNV